MKDKILDMTPKEIKSLFISEPEYWDDHFIYHQHNNPPAWDPLAKMLEIKKGDKILHLACGAGDITCMLAKYVGAGEVHAVDFSKGSLKQLKRKIEEPEELTRAMLVFGFEDSLDVISTVVKGDPIFNLWMNTRDNKFLIDLLKKLQKHRKTKARANWFLEDLKQRKETGNKIVLKQENAADVSYADEFFDRSFTFESIGILQDNTNDKWLDEMCRVTKERLMLVGWGLKPYTKIIEKKGFEIKLFGSPKLETPLFDKFPLLAGEILIADRKNGK